MSTLSEHAQWLASHQEEIIDPQREIVDPHHHLWRHSGMEPYLLEDLWSDTNSGHNITHTVFIECGAEYFSAGPEHLRPVGETEFVADIASQSQDKGGASISAIVARADLAHDALEEILIAHESAGGGFFRGIRHALARAPDGVELMIPGGAQQGLSEDPLFRGGVKFLGERGFTYDSWHYHTQNRQFLGLAQAVPYTTMILDHFGTPLGVGPFARSGGSSL